MQAKIVFGLLARREVRLVEFVFPDRVEAMVSLAEFLRDIDNPLLVFCPVRFKGATIGMVKPGAVLWATIEEAKPDA